MKKKAYKPLAQRNLANDFMRGALVSGIAAAALDGLRRPNRSAARAALQSGTILAAATLAADALQQRRYPLALLAAAGGTAGVYALQRLLPDAPAATLALPNPDSALEETLP